MASDSVFASLPSASLFRLPPYSNPMAVPPPPPSSSSVSAPPFAIPDSLYAAALDPKVPITVACVYAVTVKLLNRYNASTGKRPWRISQTRLFHGFIVLHNIFLAVYSAWTWWGMLGALQRSIASPAAPDGLAGTVDSLCRLNGPAGLGRGAFFSAEKDAWQSWADNASQLASQGLVRTESGRIWNEGLAFYGWIFYLSKFYEVFDTLIILAKGKLSSTLQTYHHAGAMMCMWAGMRYMSAPIWVFVFFNSGIHAMMYTYYTLTAFSVRVPTAIKRTLTTMQIAQFVVGASLAMVHSFISYTIPVVISVTQDATSSAASLASSATSAAATPAGAAPDSLFDGIRNALFGMASKAAAPISASSPAESIASAASTAAAAASRQQAAQTAMTYGQRVVPCIASTGETFAIWLNVTYLAPLTYLFVKFFITSYLRRSSAEAARAKKGAKAAGAGGAAARRPSHVEMAEKAGWDAARGVEREIYNQGENANGNGKNLTVNGHAARQGNGAAKH